MCSNAGSICITGMQLDKHVHCGKHICSGAYANNVKYMYTSVSCHIVDCSEFI